LPGFGYQCFYSVEELAVEMNKALEGLLDKVLYRQLAEVELLFAAIGAEFILVSVSAALAMHRLE